MPSLRQMKQTDEEDGRGKLTKRADEEDKEQGGEEDNEKDRCRRLMQTHMQNMEQPLEYRLTIYRFANMVCFSKQC